MVLQEVFEKETKMMQMGDLHIGLVCPLTKMHFGY